MSIRILLGDDDLEDPEYTDAQISNLARSVVDTQQVTGYAVTGEQILPEPTAPDRAEIIIRAALIRVTASVPQGFATRALKVSDAGPRQRQKLQYTHLNEMLANLLGGAHVFMNPSTLRNFVASMMVANPLGETTSATMTSSFGDITF